MDHSRPEGYVFDEYLAALGENWFDDDTLLLRWLSRAAVDDATLEWLRRFGETAATRYREWADVVERREKLPFIEARGPYNRVSSEVVLPSETRQMLADVHGSGVWKASLDERARYALFYLLNQNGESGIACSVACTDGLARALRVLADDPRSGEVVEQLEKATPEHWIHGAQFITEIQGGSDAATNALRAEPAPGSGPAGASREKGLWSLTGQKWFCSNLTADYWLVTARVKGGPADHRGIGLFCVPRVRSGEPNGYRIVRLKEKLGTRAVPTAELELAGALGWPVGPLDAGLKNTVAIVLTVSRLHNVMAAAGVARRATREAHAYAGFRRAFGRKLAEHPLLAASLREISDTADRAEAGAFATLDAWLEAQASPDDHDRALWARVIVSISKAITTRRSPGQVYSAMMILGGNGVEERFCALPRLWRDAAILETWEGPYTLLLMQALSDLVKFGVKGRERSFLELGLGDHLDADDSRELADILTAPDEDENILRWSELVPRLVGRFEERALEALRTGD